MAALDGEVALVTGGGSGIGQATCQFFARQGVRVVVSDIDEKGGQETTDVVYGMKYEIPAMLQSGGGAIVNMASILGQAGFENSPAYVAAKHGVLGLTKNAALEYSKKGIRVNSVGPGFIRTPLISELEENTEVQHHLISLHPIGRLGEVEEVAELVVWLSSDKASFVTGAYYAIDGGYPAP